MPVTSPEFWSHTWRVFVLFVVPIGGGIPAGVVLADKYGLSWPIMCVLYFLSDVLLACAFEPLMLYFVWKSRRSEKIARMRDAFRLATHRITGRYGLRPGPFSLVMITLGTDPMTGRLATRAAGHGFFSGWALTIMGDMLFFLLLMASTLWLNGVLGNGTQAALIIMVAMVLVPALIRRLRDRIKKDPAPPFP